MSTLLGIGFQPFNPCVTVQRIHRHRLFECNIFHEFEARTDIRRSSGMMEVGISHWKPPSAMATPSVASCITLVNPPLA